MLTEIEPTETTDAPGVSARYKELADTEDDGLALAESSQAPLSSEALAMSTLPALELSLTLAQTRSVLASAEEIWERANTSFEQKTARANFATDGEANARHNEYLAQLIGEEDKAFSMITSAMSQISAIRDVASMQREAKLSDEDYSKASARAVFCKEDCLERPLPVLLQKMQGAVASNDTALAWLYLRYGSQRLQSLDPADTAPETQIHKVQIGEILTHLKTRLADPRMKELNAEAQALIKSAQDISAKSYARRHRAEAVKQSQNARYAGL